MVMIEMCSESPGWTMSPRISFSHDLAQPEGIPIDRHRSDSTLLDSSPDFNFCINDRLQEESSSADELFSDGKILPILPRSNSKETCGSKPPKIPPVPPPIYPTLSETKPLIEEPKKESLREIIAMTDPPTEEKPPASKSFWRFTRSSSLNCGAGYKRSLICKLPLLNRSNSTGSVSQSSKKESSKSAQKQKPSPSSSSPLFPSITSSSLLPKPTPPALKKNERSHRPGAYGNGVRISPVLNVPPPYISTGTTNLFGFGYLFRTGKDGSKTKKKTATC
ncbi:uncharacterized protein [Aristolochia californica]|uniref:uncharacterized protein n=1 Tax=Aristolochia californica TaxID=171875 RepID=UPI0035D7F33F